MRHERWIAGVAAAAAMLCLPAVASAAGETRLPNEVTIKVVRVASALDPNVCTPRPGRECGGSGGAGCWRLFADHGDNNWYGSWRHHFNPYWCGNGSVITHADPGWHYQTASGLYSTSGTSRFHSGGCVGCASISFHALAHFGWYYGSSFSHSFCSTLYPAYGTQSTYTCG
jgi:hypothetical protein